MSARVDSRKKSVSEALLNSLGGYPIGYAIGIIILPLSVGWIEKEPLLASLFVTTVYATASFLRSYYLRRLFTRYGIKDNVAVLLAKTAARLKIRRSRPRAGDLEEPFLPAAGRGPEGGPAAPDKPRCR